MWTHSCLLMFRRTFVWVVTTATLINSTTTKKDTKAKLSLIIMFHVSWHYPQARNKTPLYLSTSLLTNNQQPTANNNGIHRIITSISSKYAPTDCRKIEQVQWRNSCDTLEHRRGGTIGKSLRQYSNILERGCHKFHWINMVRNHFY